MSSWDPTGTVVIGPWPPREPAAEPMVGDPWPVRVADLALTLAYPVVLSATLAYLSAEELAKLLDAWMARRQGQLVDCAGRDTSRRDPPTEGRCP